jgi:hypothetical protein
VESALHNFLVSVPHAVAIWLLLLLGLALGATVLTRGDRPERHRPKTRRAALTAKARAMWSAAPSVRPDDTTEPDEIRYAREVAAAADRAAATADRRRTAWAAAQDEVDAAWQAFDEADRAARATAKACAYPLMSRRRKPGENAERQRWLHHAASEACRNRELSIAQLNEVFAHRGWNPRLHPVVQEAALRHAIRDHLGARYREAAERERAAWRASERSAEALRTLRIEAAAAGTRSAAGQPAAGEHFRAEQWTTAELPAAA